MKGLTMAIERLEVRFSPSNADEQAIIAALEEQSEYGAKGRFLKARLIRGYVRMMREIESIKSESDPLAALERVAESMDSGTYYALRSLLYPTAPVPGESVAAVPAEVAPPPMQVAAVSVPEIPHSAASAPAQALERAAAMVMGSEADTAADAEPVASMAIAPASSNDAPLVRAAILPAAFEPVDVAPEPVPVQLDTIPDAAIEADAAAPVVEDEVATEPDPAAPATAPVVNWGRFAGIAGSRGTD
jgi:hypothetical protein